MISFLLHLPSRWPHIVMLAMVGIWALLAALSAPLFEVTYVTSGFGLFTVACYIGAFIAGSVLIFVISRSRSRIRKAASPRAMIDFRFVFLATSGLALLGIALRLYDHLVLRGMEVAFEAIASRKSEALEMEMSGGGTGASLLSFIAAPLTGFCFFPAMVLLLSPRCVKKWSRLLGWSIASFPALEAIMFRGGSSGLAYTLVVMFCAYSIRGGTTRKAMPRRALAFATLGLLTVLIGGLMFISRVLNMSDSLQSYLLSSYSSSGYVVVPSRLLLDLVDIPVLGELAFILYWLMLYVTTGAYNLMYVIEHFLNLHTLGRSQGHIIFRVVDNVLGGSGGSSVAVNPLPGLFQTMFGEVYVDFGLVGGTVQCILMGMAAGYIHLSRLRGGPVGSFMDPIAKSFLILGIMFSGFSSNGLFYLLAGLVTALLATLRRPAPARRRAPRVGPHLRPFNGASRPLPR